MNTLLEVESVRHCVEYVRMHAGASQRISEIAEIVATALMRLRARKSSQFPRDAGESSLDLSPDRSGDANPIDPEESDD